MTKTRIFLAGAIALAFSAGTVALPSLADAGQTLHGGGGHGGGSYHGGGQGGGHGGYRVGGNYHRSGHGGGGYGSVCGPAQVALGVCGPYGY
jgi:hypothetical protein